MKRIFLALSVFVLTACSPATTVTERTPQSIGNPDAKVVIEEFSDLQCPACGKISPQLFSIVERNASTMLLKYRHFPLSQHAFAFRAAEAAECAGDQGKFFEFIELAFKNQKDLADDQLKSFAESLGADMTAFNLCFDDRQKKDVVAYDLYESQRRRIPYTPSIFVNGTLVNFSTEAKFEDYLKSVIKTVEETEAKAAAEAAKPAE